MLDLEFTEAVFGVEREITIRVPVACPGCDGTARRKGTQPMSGCFLPDCGGSGEVRRVRQSILGQMVTANPCPRCGGTGGDHQPVPGVPGRRPQGGGAGIRGRCASRGGRRLDAATARPGGVRAPGRPAGDLFVHLRVKPHPRLQRSGNDLHYELHLAMTQASLGLTLPFETLDGTEDLNFAPGTQTGRVLRLRGRGVPHLQARGRGDLLVTVVVDVPTELTKEQEDLLRQLAAQRGETVAPPDTGLFSKIRHAFK